jgi:hypothetical protein
VPGAQVIDRCLLTELGLRCFEPEEGVAFFSEMFGKLVHHLNDADRRWLNAGRLRIVVQPAGAFSERSGEGVHRDVDRVGERANVHPAIRADDLDGRLSRYRTRHGSTFPIYSLALPKYFLFYDSLARFRLRVYFGVGHTHAWTRPWAARAVGVRVKPQSGAGLPGNLCLSPRGMTLRRAALNTGRKPSVRLRRRDGRPNGESWPFVAL